jgi:hypothetical protein
MKLCEAKYDRLFGYIAICEGNGYFFIGAAHTSKNFAFYLSKKPLQFLYLFYF